MAESSLPESKSLTPNTCSWSQCAAEPGGGQQAGQILHLVWELATGLQIPECIIPLLLAGLAAARMVGGNRMPMDLWPRPLMLADMQAPQHSACGCRLALRWAFGAHLILVAKSKFWNPREGGGCGRGTVID